jgi:hypothetical protein
LLSPRANDAVIAKSLVVARKVFIIRTTTVGSDRNEICSQHCRISRDAELLEHILELLSDKRIISDPSGAVDHLIYSACGQIGAKNSQSWRAIAGC